MSLHFHVDLYILQCFSLMVPNPKTPVYYSGKLIKRAAGNTIWSQSRKYKMGPKQKIQAESNTENTSRPHDESPHDVGLPKDATML